MVQVGCTINYGRKVLWKKWKKLQHRNFPSWTLVSLVVKRLSTESTEGLVAQGYSFVNPSVFGG
jgi:hypothetical protein